MKRIFGSIVFSFFFSIAYSQAPVANFSASITTLCGEGAVVFTDLSTNSPASWYWTFGDGTNSNLQNPVKYYNAAGTYTVTLTATNASGNDLEVKTGYIIVYALPNANFISAVTTGCVPITCPFTDLSTATGTTVTGWLWDFGDGNGSNAQNPTNTYTGAGSYHVTLTVTDGHGCSQQKIMTSYINALPVPTSAFFVSPIQQNLCDTPGVVNFSNNSLGANSYLWNFGDGDTSSLFAPTHVYHSYGSFTVTLITTNTIGCKDTLVANNYIVNNLFNVNFGTPDNEGCEPFVGVFVDSSVNSTGWLWNFGDPLNPPNSSFAQNPNHFYSDPGIYSVSLTATSPQGCNKTVSKSQFITVNELPEAAFGSNDSTACKVPFTFTFNNLTGGTTAWHWNFGDGTGSTLQNPPHIYTAPGYYGVSLWVTDTNGCNSPVDTIPFFISIVEPIAFFVTDTPYGCIPLEVIFEDFSFANPPINSWFWDFDDGHTSFADSTSNTFVSTGEYNVMLAVANSEGCVDTVVVEVVAGIPVDTVHFTVDDSIVCSWDSVKFTALTSIYANHWFWMFGDTILPIGTDTGETPKYEYHDTGYFNVTMIAYYNGCPGDTVTYDSIVRVLPPVVYFSVDEQIGCSYPHPVAVTDSSIGADTWLWKFGDPVSGVNDTSTSPSPPPHTYNSPGIYTITLSVTNNVSGCIDTTNVSIIVPESLSKFGQNTVEGCKPLTVGFTDSSTTDNIIQRMIWDFGDGTVIGNFPPFTMITSPIVGGGATTTGTYKNPTHKYTVAGVYKVVLSIIDGNDCLDTSIIHLITVNELPVAHIIANPDSGCLPVTSLFTDISTGQIGMSAWSWTFGDPGSGTINNTSNLQNPSHLYSNIGYYDIQLMITDSNGCKDTAIFDNYVFVTNPNAAFTTASTSCANTPSLFQNGSSGVGLTYLWIFGDGYTSTVQNPVHIYNINATDTFEIKLIITDVNGCKDSATSNKIISKPVADFTVDQTIADCPPLIVNFTDASTPAVSWFWDFGDGITSIIKNPQHVYNTVGTFDVSLRITNVLNCRDTVKLEDFIIVGGPTVDFDYSPKKGCMPLTVDFVTSNAQNVASYTWIFDDFTQGTGSNISHVYNAAGLYNPLLIIKDSLLFPGDSVCTVTIPGNLPILVYGPVVDFAADDTFLCSVGDVQFNNLTAPVIGGETWLWDFGDGITSTLQNPGAHTYTDPGVYTVTLTVHIDTCTFSLTKVSYITIFDSPIVQYSYNKEGCEPFAVYFDLDETTVTAPAASFLWHFGDGNTSSEMNPTHVYSQAGLYGVSLEVTYVNGCVFSYDGPDSVTVFVTPVADFHIEPIILGTTIPTLTFVNTSEGGISYFWSFGDNVTTTEFSPSHSYLYEDEYRIYLVVENIYGCLDTMEIVENIYLNIHVPNIFTPNGDGINDLFELSINGLLRDFKIDVFNIWGQVVYKSADYVNNWDGTDTKGNRLLSGNYYYVMKHKERTAWAGWVRIVNEEK